MKTSCASYRASYHFAVAGEANIFAETQIKLYEEKTVICVLGERSKKNLKHFSYLIILLKVTQDL